jgi:FkbM family methyltransferase
MSNLKLLARRIFSGYVRRSFSQQKQDRWISELVFPKKKNGYFVEAGAHDGITTSNTYFLERYRDWDGVLVEPNPILFRQLERIRAVNLVNCALSSEKGKLNFKPDGGLGRIVPDSTSEDTISVDSLTLEHVLNESNAPSVIDYLSLDVEGHEDQVLHDFPIDGYHFNAIMVETPSGKLRDKLRCEGYTKIIEIPGIDALFVDEDIKSGLQDKFTDHNWSWLEFKINALVEKL